MEAAWSLARATWKLTTFECVLRPGPLAVPQNNPYSLAGLTTYFNLSFTYLESALLSWCTVSVISSIAKLYRNLFVLFYAVSEIRLN